MDPKQQHRKLASLQEHWKANAMADYRYNCKRASEEQSAGNRILAAGYRKEAGWDLQWGNKRGRIAKSERKKG